MAPLLHSLICLATYIAIVVFVKISTYPQGYTAEFFSFSLITLVIMTYICYGMYLYAVENVRAGIKDLFYVVYALILSLAGLALWLELARHPSNSENVLVLLFGFTFSVLAFYLSKYDRGSWLYFRSLNSYAFIFISLALPLLKIIGATEQPDKQSANWGLPQSKKKQEKLLREWELEGVTTVDVLPNPSPSEITLFHRFEQAYFANRSSHTVLQFAQFLEAHGAAELANRYYEHLVKDFKNSVEAKNYLASRKAAAGIVENPDLTP